jgi:hypothetical protein
MKIRRNHEDNEEFKQQKTGILFDYSRYSGG